MRREIMDVLFASLSDIYFLFSLFSIISLETCFRRSNFATSKITSLYCTAGISIAATPRLSNEKEPNIPLGALFKVFHEVH
jgi:hypothetical protein